MNVAWKCSGRKRLTTEFIFRFPKNHKEAIEKRYSDVPNGFICLAFTANRRFIHIFAQILGVAIPFARTRCQFDIGLRRHTRNGHRHCFIGDRPVEI